MVCWRQFSMGAGRAAEARLTETLAEDAPVIGVLVVGYDQTTTKSPLPADATAG